MRHGHMEVQKYLRAHGGELLGLEVSVEMCNAAATGDVQRIKTLIENGANPNAGDYDDRTGSSSFRPLLTCTACDPLSTLCTRSTYTAAKCRCQYLRSSARTRAQPALHLAASNGQASVLDYLMRHSPVHVNVNPTDRLGGIPLVIVPASFSSSVEFTGAHREWENPRFCFFAHAGMCMAGTPTEDAYRHGEMVAVAILEASGGVRQDSPLVCQTPMLCSHRITDRIREITHLNLNSWKTLPGCLEIAALTR
jgi:hypothetical protein